MTGQDGYRVTTSTLRGDAAVWDQQAEQMGAIARKCDELKMGDIQAGVFLMMVNAYGEVVDALQGRAAEGRQAMSEIGAGLRQVAQNYEQQETSQAAAFRGLDSDRA